MLNKEVIYIKDTSKDRKSITIRVDNNLYNQIYKVASLENITVSTLIRKYINEGIRDKVILEDSERLTSIIQQQLELTLDGYMNRIIAMISKNIKSSEAGKQATYNLLREFSNKNTEEIIEKCELLAIEYNSKKVHR